MTTTTITHETCDHGNLWCALELDNRFRTVATKRDEYLAGHAAGEDEKAPDGYYYATSVSYKEGYDYAVDTLAREAAEAKAMHEYAAERAHEEGAYRQAQFHIDTDYYYDAP